MEKSKDFFVHLRVSGAGDGAATLAVVDGKVGVALCSPKEQFNRKVGRSISRQRALARATHEAAHLPRLSFDLPAEGSATLRERAVDEFLRLANDGGFGRVEWLSPGVWGVEAGPWNVGR